MTGPSLSNQPAPPLSADPLLSVGVAPTGFVILTHWNLRLHSHIKTLEDKAFIWTLRVRQQPYASHWFSIIPLSMGIRESDMPRWKHSSS